VEESRPDPAPEKTRVKDAERNRATVARLIAILSGEAPIETGAEFVAHDVVAYVDGWRFEGINVWANWIHYIRTRDRVASPTLLLDALHVEHDGTVSVRGRWRGVRGGRPVISKTGAAKYRLVDGRIVEIWSTRRNYALLCGAHVEYRAGFAAELLRAWRWKARAPQLDLAGGVPVPPISFRSPALSSSAFVAAD
jgi:hypothetical protein